MERVHLDAAQVRHVQQRRQVVHHQVTDHPALAVLAPHRAARDPLRRVRGRGLLVEVRAGDPVGHPLHRERAVGQVRQAELAPLHLQPPGVAALLGPERRRELDGERAVAGASLPRRHRPSVAVGPVSARRARIRSSLLVGESSSRGERMPPRSMWKGAISFGLVTIPVAVFPATEERSLKFNQLHDQDMGRIRYKRVCSVDGEEVDFEHIVKGYEVEKDRYIILTDEGLAAVPVESSRAIDIQQFVDLEEIDPILFKKSYYLVPDETGAKAYALLRKALAEESKVGIAKQLIESLTEPWNPERFKDGYREALLSIVEKKLAGEPIEAPAEAPPAKVVDLMEALKASVAAARERTPASSGGAKKRSPAKKPAARKQPAKRP